MITITADIQTYKSNLSKSSFSEDIDFLDKIGTDLKKLKRKQFKTSLILEVEDLIELVSDKFIDNREDSVAEYLDYSEDFELLLGKTKGLAQSLGAKVKNRNIEEEEGFEAIFRLGMRLKKLAELAYLICIPLVSISELLK